MNIESDLALLALGEAIARWPQLDRLCGQFQLELLPALAMASILMQRSMASLEELS